MNKQMMAKAKTKRPQFTATAEHNLGVALANVQFKLSSLDRDLRAHSHMIHALEDAICPRVAARLTALENAQPAKPAPSEAELWNTTWTAANALSQEQLGRMLQSLQRVYWKKRLATEK